MKVTAGENMNPDLKQKIDILAHVRFEIKSFFLEPESAAKGRDVEESIKMIRMAHCRILREFFTKKQRRGDDVLVGNFDFPSCEWKDLWPGVGDAEKVEQCFNKRLFHLTYSRLHVSDEKWCIYLAFKPIEARAKEFIKHIIKSLSNGGLTATPGVISIFGENATALKTEVNSELNYWKQLEMDIGLTARRVCVPLQANTANV